MRNVFPVRFYATDKYGWADCPALAKMVWMRIRKDHPDMIWYGADMEVQAPDRIVLYVYEMEDNFHGGIGAKIFETTVTKFTSNERDVLDNVVLKIYTEAASNEWQHREDIRRIAETFAIRKEMFGV